MLSWTDVTLVYAVYLAALAWVVPRFRGARPAASAALGVCAFLAWWWTPPGEAPWAAALRGVVVPSLALLGTYRVSGTFFVRPSLALERALLYLDDVLLQRSGVLRAYRTAPRAVRVLFEVLYVLVYVVVPAGATVLLVSGRADALPAYWSTVFTAELLCYAALPWLQTRPPRALEPAAGGGDAARRLNLWLLRHGSIQGNTFPSAHAAGAIAIGLCVSSALPGPGLAFLVVGAGITVATVLGRYHYALDSILGVAIALAAWVAVMA